MGIRLPSVILSNAKQVLKLQNNAKNQCGVPKGHVAVYVGELEKKRFVVPISYLSHPPFVEHTFVSFNYHTFFQIGLS